MPSLRHRALQLSSVVLGRRPPSLPASFDCNVHLEAALDWILVAREQSADGGIPAYYDLLRGRWRRSYPETTGYIIPTLLACADRPGRAKVRDVALELADYLLAIRTPEGGVAHWDRAVGGAPTPIVFDTGQVIFGWVSAWRETRHAKYINAARSAADWLLAIQDVSGAWTKYQHLNTTKVIDTRVALALVNLGLLIESQEYVDAARRNLDWALAQQLANGWFHRASFRPRQDPFTHTIAYTAEGLLEAGLLLGEPDYVQAGSAAARALLHRQRPNGSLASTYNDRWQATTASSCLTGNCQMALLWMRLFERTSDLSFRDAAGRAIAYVASTQQLRTSDACLRGAVAGSYPPYGAYERMKYPNWAAKFFIDELLCWERSTTRGNV
jgi:uncharacterized protein YyaL (SSP411 family)